MRRLSKAVALLSASLLGLPTLRAQGPEPATFWNSATLLRL